MKYLQMATRFIKGFFLTGLIVLALPAVVLAAPSIFYTDIISGPNSGGENNNGAYLTIFGKGFGATRGTSSVTVGGGAVAAYKYWSDTKVSVQIGSAAATGNVVITTSSGAATGPDQFTVRPGRFFYVAATGSDSNGAVNDITRPYRSVNYVRGLMQAGDFAVVRGGTYILTDPLNNLVGSSFIRANTSGGLGTAGSPLSVIGYPGETVTIQIDRAGDRLVGNYGFVSHWVVANFNVVLTICSPSPDNGNVVVMTIGNTAAQCPQANTNGNGRFSDGRFVNIDISGGCGGLTSSQIEVGLSDNIKLLGITIRDSGDNGEAHSHPIYLAAEQDTTEVGWCKVYNYQRSRALVQVHTDQWFTCWNYASINNIKIHDNEIYNVNGQAILIGGGTGLVEIYNNVIYNAPSRVIAPAYNDVIALRGNGGFMDARLYNNTVYANPAVGGAGWLIGIGYDTYPPLRLTFENNIFYVGELQDRYYGTDTYANMATWVATPGNVISKNNIWYGSASGLPVFAGTGDVSVDPKFVSSATGNFHLLSASQAIGAGFNVGTPVLKDHDGNAWTGNYDIGAFKYRPATLLNPPTNLRAR